MNCKILKFIAPIALTAILSGCQLFKEYELPQNNAVVNDFEEATHLTDTIALAHLEWREVFTDPQLQSLISRALDANKNLANARENIEIAQAQLKGAKLSYFPSVAFAPQGGAGVTSMQGSHLSWTYSLPLSAQWEVDVFGKLLNNKRKAKVDVEQAEYYAQAVRSQLVCGVANTYYALVWLNQQLGLTKRTAAIWKEQVETMELMKNAARVTEAAVVQSRANYYSILSNIPDLEESIATTQNTLSLLLNTYPQKWEIGSNLEINVSDEVMRDIPLYYLAVRPDVRAAERAMASAYYATNIARTNFYPSLAISLSGGFTNSLGSLVLNPGKWFFNMAGQLTAPIFSRGRNIAQLEAAQAQQRIALNTFETTVLSAAADVSDALVKIQKADEKREYILKQIDQLEKSVEYTEELMNFGQSTTYLEILTARSALLSAQLASLANMHNKATALISLYQAAGGGY